MQTRMQHQGGWAGTFVVVGVVLLVGLVGGVYFLKSQTSDQLATNDDGASSEIERTLEEASSDNKPADKRSAEQENSKPDSEKKPNVTPDSSSDKSPQSNSDDQEVKLPETGPGDVFAKLLAITALTAASVAYLRSR